MSGNRKSAGQCPLSRGVLLSVQYECRLASAEGDWQQSRATLSCRACALQGDARQVRAQPPKGCFSSCFVHVLSIKLNAPKKGSY